MTKVNLVATMLFVASPLAIANPLLERGRQAVLSMTGCYLVDYSYTETEALKPGYTRDSRVYDVNQDKSVKEWIYAESVTPTRIRLQHLLFATDLDGKVIEGTEMKHTGEDWEYGSSHLYEFVAPQTWNVRDLTSTPDTWTRRVTNLDDGLRYQCSAQWTMNEGYPEWNCGDNYAPIPGRETRDMGRRDYQALIRSTRIIAYSGNWLERQSNTKIIHDTTTDPAGVRVPLAKELGKNWYVRLPDSECAPIRAFAEPKREFWTVMREAWDQVLTGDRAFREKSVPGQSRYLKMLQLENRYVTQDLKNPEIRASAMRDIRALIDTFRAP